MKSRFTCIGTGPAHRVKEKKPDAVYVYPKEGTTFWTDVIAVPEGCAEPRGAKKFVNWMMSPELAAIASNYTVLLPNAVVGFGRFSRRI